MNKPPGRGARGAIIDTGSGATSLFKLDKRDADKLIAAKGSTYRHVEIRSAII